MSNVELLPCPFCKEPMVMREWHANSEYFVVDGQHGLTCLMQLTDDIIHVDAYTLADKWNHRAPQWQPIETAPKDGQYLLVAAHDRYGKDDKGGAENRIAKAYWCDDGSLGRPHWVGGHLSSHFIVTHWQPLPTPPTQGDKT